VHYVAVVTSEAYTGSNIALYAGLGVAVIIFLSVVIIIVCLIRRHNLQRRRRKLIRFVACFPTRISHQFPVVLLPSSLVESAVCTYFHRSYAIDGFSVLNEHVHQFRRSALAAPKAAKYGITVRIDKHHSGQTILYSVF